MSDKLLYIPCYQDKAPDLSGIRNDVSALRVALGAQIEDDSHTGIGASDYESLKVQFDDYLNHMRVKHAGCRGVLLYFTGHGWVDRHGTFECLKDVKIREMVDWIRGETWQDKDVFVIIDACRVNEAAEVPIAKSPQAVPSLGIRHHESGEGRTSYLFACPVGRPAYEVIHGAQRFGQFTHSLIDLIGDGIPGNRTVWLTFNDIVEALETQLPDQPPQAEGEAGARFILNAATEKIQGSDDPDTFEPVAPVPGPLEPPPLRVDDSDGCPRRTLLPFMLMASVLGLLVVGIATDGFGLWSDPPPGPGPHGPSTPAPPVLADLRPPSGHATNTPSVTLRGSVQCKGTCKISVVVGDGVPISAKLNPDGSWEAPMILPEEGNHTICVTAETAPGVSVKEDLQYTLDSQPPDLTVSNPIETNAAKVTLSGTVSDSGVGVRSVTIEGREALLADGNWSLVVPGDPRTVEVVAMDRVGNRIVRSTEIMAATTPSGALSWATTIKREPDPDVVTDEEGRRAMLATGLPWWVKGKKHGIEFRLVPPGTFSMGSLKDAPGRFSDEHLHKVTITRPFYLGVYEVTQEQYTAVMGGNPSRFKTPDRPVDSISVVQVLGQGKEAGPHTFLGRTGFRLPTEAEWEYVCRAGTNTATYAGPIKIDGIYDASILDDIAWYGGNSGIGYDLDEGYSSAHLHGKVHEFDLCGTRRIGTKKANPWGFYDMLGNVLELCRDRYYPTSPGAARGEAVDPVALDRDADHVYRGGSWKDGARFCRAPCRRNWIRDEVADERVGFRVARDPD